MQLDVLNKEGKKTGRSVDISDQIFGIEPNDHVIYMAVKNYLASQHRGTHKTKGRSEVKGSTHKLHRQKGTGGSRKGDIKNPLYHGGGTVFGPQPHSYGFKMNKKEKDLAKISALAYKASEEAIKVVEEIQLEAPKTKTLQSALSGLELDGKKVLYVTADYEKNLFLSLRNIPRVKVIPLKNINTYDIVNSSFLLFSEKAAEVFKEEEHTAEKKESAKVEKKETAKAEEKETAKAEKKETTKAEKKETAKAEKKETTKADDKKDNKE